MNDLVEAPLHLHPTINVRALLGHSARVTKVRARAPLPWGSPAAALMSRHTATRSAAAC